MSRQESRIFSRAVTGFGLLASLGCTEARASKVEPVTPPPTVYFTAVTRRDLPIFIESVGLLDGYVNADIRARVRGYLQTQLYKDGAYVKAGQTLFTIEPTEYAATLSGAKAALMRARVAVDRNRIELERGKGLFSSGMLSRQELDNATASVADAEGQVQAAQAQLTQAQLNLSYTQVKSPLAGIAGLALVRVGNLVGQEGPTLLTTVSQLDPIRVNFPLSEVDYVRNPERFSHLEARDLAWAKAQFARLDTGQPAEQGDTGLEIVLSDGHTHEHRGVVVSANRQVDPSTGTLQIQGLIPNPDLILRPGQYARVRMRRMNEGINVLSVPEKALIVVQGTYSVGVLGPDRKVHLRRVELGPSSAGQRIVVSGLAEGDQIVVEGIQKISEGATVNPVIAPPAVLATPASSGTPVAGTSGTAVSSSPNGQAVPPSTKP
jgi:membrane fusion protein (multidrug efflux system)